MSRVHKLSNSEKAAHAPRIVGGKLRGQSLEFTPSSRTRPMKDRVRETLFDLVGPKVKQTVAIDLFAGTGALGFEALSRGASKAIFAERHFPTADTIVRSARRLGVEDVTTVLPGNVLLWSRRMPTLPESTPWLVFVSPPWSFFSERIQELMALVDALAAKAPSESMFVVESSDDFDPTHLPGKGWDSRTITPAILYRKQFS